MHDRDILPLDIINHHLPHGRLPPPVPQKQQVPALESRFHTAGQDDDDGRGGVGRDGEAFPQHEGGAEDEGEVEELGQGLAGVEGGGEEGGEHGLWGGVGDVVRESGREKGGNWLVDAAEWVSGYSESGGFEDACRIGNASTSFTRRWEDRSSIWS